MSIVINNFLGKVSRDIAVKHGFPIVTVETIIKSYLNSLVDSAIKGERIIIDGLTSITVVKGSVEDYELVKRSLSSRVRSIAYKQGIPQVTVETVIRDYLESLVELAKQGKTIEINGVAKIKVEKDETGDYVVRGRVAPALKSRLESISAGEYFVRGRVSPVLKATLQNMCNTELIVS